MARAHAVSDRLFDARPDRLDLRDIAYQPPLRSLPPRFPADADIAALLPGYVAKGLILDQGTEGACTGFGLACVMNYLLWVRHRGTDAPFETVSPRMLYELARRYDEWPGMDYDGSSCRGALKGLHKHGVCSAALWPYEVKEGKSVFVSPGAGWELDAAQRPLGVYYRIRSDSVVDLQAAIRDIGAIYVSGNVHDGWDDVAPQAAPSKHADLPVIPPPKDAKKLFGHAFAIVGYDERGFLVQNSWGTGWGASGFAVLPYDDWVEHATDAWALALGVPVLLAERGGKERGELRAVASSHWRVPGGRSLTKIARDARNPANPPDDPWPIDHPFEHPPYQPWSTHEAYMHTLVSGSDGALVVSDFTHSPADVVGYARRIGVEEPLAWLKAHGEGNALRLALYAHGGLNNEEESIARIRVLAPYFAANGIYPIFLTWKTGIGETLSDILRHCLRKLTGTEDPRAAGLLEFLGDVKDRAIEGFAHVLAKGVWTQMRENAEAAKAPRRLLDLLALSVAELHAKLPAGKRLEVHLVGHSAGALVLGHLLERMTQDDLRRELRPVETCTLLAPACSVQFAVTHYLPAVDNGLLDLDRVWLHYLSDANEKKDGLPTPEVPAYGKSLLYLVSRALDDVRKMPLLGMERALLPAYAASTDQWAEAELPWLAQWHSRWSGVGAARGVPVARPDVIVNRENDAIQATHGSFDNNVEVVSGTLRRIRGRALVAPVEWLDY
jgi:hypothetical protein